MTGGKAEATTDPGDVCRRGTMESPFSHFEAWVARDVRDRCLEIVAGQLAAPAGPLSVSKLQAAGGIATDESVERLAIHLVDLVIERFLFEVDQRITMGQMRLELRPPQPGSEWSMVGQDVLLYEAYTEWVEKHSAVKGVAELDALFRLAKS